MSEIQSSIVTKIVQILDVLTQSSDPMSYSAIVAETGFNKSSTHRVLAILAHEGLVEFDDSSKTYTVGSKLVGWARAAWQKTDLQQLKDADLIQLRDQTGLNVALSVLVENSVMFIRTFDRKSVRYAPKIGEQSSLHCTAAGKIFLAFSESSETNRMLKAWNWRDSLSTPLRLCLACGKKLQMSENRDLHQPIEKNCSRFLGSQFQWWTTSPVLLLP